MKMRTLMLSLVLLVVSGCNFAHLAQSSGAAGAGALVTAIATSNPAYIAAGAALSTVTVEVLDPLNTNQESTVEILQEVPEEDRAAVLKHKQDIAFWQNTVMWLIGGGLILILAAWLIPGPQMRWLFRK